MKILIVQLGWSGHGVSGGDKHLLEAAEYWQKKNEVTVFLPGNGRNFVEKNIGIGLTGVRLATAFEPIRFSFLKSLLSIILAYIQRLIFGPLQVLLSHGHFEVIVSSSHFLYDLLPAVALKIFRGLKIVVYVYHLIGDQARPSSLRNRLSSLSERLSLVLITRLFDLVFTDNYFVQARLGQWGVDPSKIKVTPVGIRRPIILEGLNKKYDLCFLGRLVKSKGVLDLVEIMKMVRERISKPQLVVMGMGGELPNLRYDFDQAGLSDSVIFMEAVDERTKYRVLQESRVFVAPSYEEGWGLALAEALSCGLPAVAYDLTVFREVFKKGPVLVPAGNREALAAAVIKLLTDEEYLKLKSAEAKSSVQDFYLDQVLPAELKMIENL